MIATQPTASIQLSKSVERTEADFGLGIRERAQFGWAVTQPRPVGKLTAAPSQFDLTDFYTSGSGTTSPTSALPFGSFEGTPTWTPSGVTVSSNTALFTGGRASLEVSGTGTLTSPKFNPADLPAVGTTLNFHVYVPDAAPDPFSGTIEVRLRVPRALLDASIGKVDLSAAPQGRWVSVALRLSDKVREALFENDDDATFKFVLTLPAGQHILIDSLRFGGRLISAPDARCKLGVFNSRDYFLCADDTTFSHAREQCLAVKADLVTIDSKAEDDFLTSRMLESAFIGATDETIEGDWYWKSTNTRFWAGGLFGRVVNGSYANWKFGEPSNGLLVERDCGVKAPLLLLGKWEATSCGSSKAFICELP